MIYSNRTSSLHLPVNSNSTAPRFCFTPASRTKTAGRTTPLLSFVSVCIRGSHIATKPPYAPNGKKQDGQSTAPITIHNHVYVTYKESQTWADLSNKLALLSLEIWQEPSYDHATSDKIARKGHGMIHPSGTATTKLNTTTTSGIRMHSFLTGWYSMSWFSWPACRTSAHKESQMSAQTYHKQAADWLTRICGRSLMLLDILVLVCYYHFFWKFSRQTTQELLRDVNESKDCYHKRSTCVEHLHFLRHNKG